MSSIKNRQGRAYFPRKKVAKPQKKHSMNAKERTRKATAFLLKYTQVYT